jgi:hypothetical protein
MESYCIFGVHKIDLANQASDRQYTYPMAILSTLPLLPADDALSQAQSSFFTIFKPHVFLSKILFPDVSSSSRMPPYLKISLACLGRAVSGDLSYEGGFGSLSPPVTDCSASGLFLSGNGLWGVMLEVDNREARLLESIMAVSGQALARFPQKRPI